MIRGFSTRNDIVFHALLSEAVNAFMRYRLREIQSSTWWFLEDIFTRVWFRRESWHKITSLLPQNLEFGGYLWAELNDTFLWPFNEKLMSQSIELTFFLFILFSQHNETVNTLRGHISVPIVVPNIPIYFQNYFDISISLDCYKCNSNNKFSRERQLSVFILLFSLVS